MTMSRKSFYLCFAVVLVLDVVSALSARQAYNTESTFYLLVAMLSLAAAGYFFIKLLDAKVTIIINAIWIALGSINVTIASYLVFGETLTWTQVAGMVITILGLIFLEMFAPNEEESDKPVTEQTAPPHHI